MSTELIRIVPFANWNSPMVWLIIVVVVLLFGGSKIPQLMRGVGRGVGELQKGLEEGKRGLAQMKEEHPDEDTQPRDDTKPKA